MTEQVGSISFEVKNRVRVARAEKGWTQQELADQAGVTRQTVGLIENDKYNPTLSLCLRLAIALDTELGDLFRAEVVTDDETD